MEKVVTHLPKITWEKCVVLLLLRIMNIFFSSENFSTINKSFKCSFRVSDQSKRNLRFFGARVILFCFERKPSFFYSWLMDLFFLVFFSKTGVPNQDVATWCQGCRQILFPWYLYLFHHLGVPPYIYNTFYGCRKLKKVGNPCSKRSNAKREREWGEVQQLVFLLLKVLFVCLCH